MTPEVKYQKGNSPFEYQCSWQEDCNRCEWRTSGGIFWSESRNPIGRFILKWNKLEEFVADRKQFPIPHSLPEWQTKKWAQYHLIPNPQIKSELSNFLISHWKCFPSRKTKFNHGKDHLMSNECNCNMAAGPSNCLELSFQFKFKLFDTPDAVVFCQSFVFDAQWECWKFSLDFMHQEAASWFLPALWTQQDVVLPHLPQPQAANQGKLQCTFENTCGLLFFMHWTFPVLACLYLASTKGKCVRQTHNAANTTHNAPSLGVKTLQAVSHWARITVWFTAPHPDLGNRKESAIRCLQSIAPEIVDKPKWRKNKLTRFQWRNLDLYSWNIDSLTTRDSTSLSVRQLLWQNTRTKHMVVFQDPAPCYCFREIEILTLILKQEQPENTRDKTRWFFLSIVVLFPCATMTPRCLSRVTEILTSGNHKGWKHQATQPFLQFPNGNLEWSAILSPAETSELSPLRCELNKASWEPDHLLNWAVVSAHNAAWNHLIQIPNMKTRDKRGAVWIF